MIMRIATVLLLAAVHQSHAKPPDCSASTSTTYATEAEAIACSTDGAAHQMGDRWMPGASHPAATDTATEDEDECPACAEDHAACWEDATCRAIVERSITDTGATPTAADWANPLYAKSTACQVRNCPDADDCPACAGETANCLGDATCSAIAAKTAAGGAPTAADVQDKFMGPLVTCRATHCSDGDDDECPACAADNLACFSDATCRAIGEGFAAGAPPTAADLANPLIAKSIACQARNCPDNADGDDDDVIECLEASCTIFSGCMADTTCEAELQTAVGGAGEPTLQFVAAQSALFQTLFKCYQAKCQDPVQAAAAFEAEVVRVKAAKTAACADPNSAACATATDELATAEANRDSFDPDSAVGITASLVAATVAVAAALF